MSYPTWKTPCITDDGSTTNDFNDGSCKTATIERKYFCHRYQSSCTTNAKRCNSAADVQQKTMDTVRNTTYPYRKWVVLQKKCAVMDSLVDAIPRQVISLPSIEHCMVLYDCFHDDPILQDLLPDFEINAPSRVEVRNVYTDLQEVDCMEGCKLMESEFVPVFILPPRNYVIDHSSSAHADVAALRRLLSKHTKTCVRGSKRTGISFQYATFGVTSYQGAPGLGMKKIHECCAKDYNHLLKMKRRLEFIIKRWLPFRMLTALSLSRELVGDTATMDDRRPSRSSIWSSVATSFNYMSPAHTDEDSFLSCLTVSFLPKAIELSTAKKSKKKYDVNLPVACYFCFPEYGLAVALRPGDVLIFNPLHYHCLSQRTEDYRDEDIFVTSFYMKAKQLGGNYNYMNKINNLEM